MVEVDPSTGTLYINAAAVPRVRAFPAPEPAEAPQPHESSYDSDGAAGAAGAAGTAGGSGQAGDDSGGNGAREETVRAHHFVLVELFGGAVTAARDVWVGVRPAGSNSGGGGSGSSRACSIVHQQELVRTTLAAAAAGAGQEGGNTASGASAAAAVASADAADQRAGDAEGAASGSYVCSIYRAFADEWEPFVLQLPAAVDA